MDERGKGRCSLCRDTDHPISRPTFHPCFIIFDFLTAPGGSSFLLSSRKHIPRVYLIKKSLLRKTLDFEGYVQKFLHGGTYQFSTRRNRFCVNDTRFDFDQESKVRPSWKPTCPRSIRFDSTRLSDGWKRGTNAAIIGQTGEHSTLFRSRETNRETIEENQ